MNTDDQSIIKMLEQRIMAHEEKINSFRQAIRALSGSTAEASGSNAPMKKRRGRKPGSKNLVKSSEINTAKTKRGRRGSSAQSVSKSEATKKPRKPRTGETMETWVLRQMEDGVPKTTRTLMELFNKETGRNLDISGVSARLAIIKRKGSLISAKNPADGLSYLGKSEWFNDGNLKEEYFAKLSA